MKYLLLLLIVILSCGIMGCGGEPEDRSLQPKHDLKAALDAYYSNRLDTFLLCVDFGEDLDPLEEKIVMATYRRDLTYVNETAGGVRAVEPKSVEFDGDSVAFVFYDIIYGNQSRETSSQKMVKTGESWKIKARN